MQLNTVFSDRVVLVTGAAQGIGAAIGKSFVDAGAIVHLADLDGEGVDKTAIDIGAMSHSLDLSDRGATAELIKSIDAQNGRLDILVHAAGGVRGQTGKPIEDVSIDDWRKIFEANVDSAFWLAQAVAPIMKKNKWGRIINISSGAGLRPSLTGIQAYAAAKHALVGLTRQLSWELGPFGITTNSVAPGLVLSNPSTRKQWENYSTDFQKELLDNTHTKRLGEPEDIAAAVMFFASENAGWVSGQVLSVDGGRS
jgi:3-oxoacyl-[acyl-carrier protein] reductase